MPDVHVCCALEQSTPHQHNFPLPDKSSVASFRFLQWLHYTGILRGSVRLCMFTQSINASPARVFTNTGTVTTCDLQSFSSEIRTGYQHLNVTHKDAVYSQHSSVRFCHLEVGHLNTPPLWSTGVPLPSS